MQFLKPGKGKPRQSAIPARQTTLREPSRSTILSLKANEAAIRHYARKKPPFRLLDLPTELRDIIYSYHAADLQKAYEVAMNMTYIELGDSECEEISCLRRLTGDSRCVFPCDSFAC